MYVGRQKACWELGNVAIARRRQKVMGLQSPAGNKQTHEQNLVLAKKEIKKLKDKCDKLICSEKDWGDTLSREE